MVQKTGSTLEYVNENPHDFYIVSGDLTRNQNPKDVDDSMQNVCDFLFNDYNIEELGEIGLKLDQSKTIVTPGNHDLDYDNIGGNIIEWWLKTSERFYQTFSEKCYIPNQTDLGVDYHIMRFGNSAIIYFYLDTSYLGGSKEDQSPKEHFFNSGRYNKVIRGKLLLQQINKLLEYYYKGRNGKLINKVEKNNLDSKTFATSYKILVMHHFLFDPEKKDQVKQLPISKDTRQKVFKYLSVCDFNLLLCGHKHRTNIYDMSIKETLDKRMVRRACLEELRKFLGLKNFTQQINYNGKDLKKTTSILLSFIYACAKNNEIKTDIKNELNMLILKESVIISEKITNLIYQNDFEEMTLLNESDLDLLEDFIGTLDEPLLAEIDRFSNKYINDILKIIGKKKLNQSAVGSSVFDNSKTKSNRLIRSLTLSYDNANYFLDQEIIHYNSSRNKFGID